MSPQKDDLKSLAPKEEKVLIIEDSEPSLEEESIKNRIQDEEKEFDFDEEPQAREAREFKTHYNADILKSLNSMNLDKFTEDNKREVTTSLLDIQKIDLKVQVENKSIPFEKKYVKEENHSYIHKEEDQTLKSLTLTIPEKHSLLKSKYSKISFFNHLFIKIEKKSKLTGFSSL